MRQRVYVVLAALSMSVLALRAMAGHDSLSGRELFAVSATHGLDTGDLPVLALWFFGLACCYALWPPRR